jgi:hypothetical protein
MGDMTKLIDTVRPGDRVTIVDRFGKRRTGRAVMKCIAGGWVLNMGGRHGTPGIANDVNTVRVAFQRSRLDKSAGSQ